MRKIDKKISQQGIKRYNKNKARQARNKSKLENHIKWLELMINANVDMDWEKLCRKKNGTLKDQSYVKYIIDRLVSANVPVYKKAQANGRA